MTTAASRPATATLGLIDELVIHYRGAHVLMTAVTLGVFDALEDGALSAGQVAATVGGDERVMDVLLEALAAMGIVEPVAGGYINGAVAQQHLRTHSAQSLVSNLQYQQFLAGAWADLPRIARTGEPAADLMRLLGDQPQFAERYIHGMADISQRPARELASLVDGQRVDDVLDVGGGPAVYAMALAQRCPRARITLLDLEPTLAIARRRLGPLPGSDRIILRPGDYHEAEFGEKCFDLVLFSHVLHDEGEAACRRMLQRACQALRPGGTVMIHDFMPDGGGDPLFPALFSVHMLTYTQSGRAWCADQYECWLRDCGLQPVGRHLICADRPTATTAILACKR